MWTGRATASDAAVRAARTEQPGAAILDWLGLTIAAVASSRRLPLHTRDGADFVGLESMAEIVEV